MPTPFTPCSACQSHSTCTLQDECERPAAAVGLDLLEAHDRYAQALTRIAALDKGEAGRIAREALGEQA